MKGMESAMVTLRVMARLDPRFREDAIEPAHARAPNKSYDRLDGPLPAFAGTSFAGHDKRRKQLAFHWQKRQITRCDRSCRGLRQRHADDLIRVQHGAIVVLVALLDGVDVLHAFGHAAPDRVFAVKPG